MPILSLKLIDVWKAGEVFAIGSQKKVDPRSTEKVCAYASGKFPVIKSTIDAEIHACMETITGMKIHYLDKSEVALRIDCQAIISFYNKSANNKPSRVM